MFNRNRNRDSSWRIATLILAFLLVATAVAPAYAQECCGRYSGDDAYDPAAGGNPEASVGAPAASARSRGTTYSGDDAYDPAAGARPGEWLIVRAGQSAAHGDRSYSGDDAYDPAAGGTHLRALARFSASVTQSAACALTPGEIARRDAMRVPAGLSGDDAYDAAAGGMPELSLLPFATDAQLAALCASTAEGS